MATRLSAACLRTSRRMQEKIMEGILFLCAASSVFITLSIVGVLLFESWPSSRTFRWSPS